MLTPAQPETGYGEKKGREVPSVPNCALEDKAIKSTEWGPKCDWMIDQNSGEIIAS